MSIFTRSLQSWDMYTDFSGETDITSVNRRARQTLELLGVDRDVLSDLQEAAPVLLPYKHELASKMIERFQSTEQIHRAMERSEGGDRLKEKLEIYLDEFFKGNLDQSYIESRLKLGKVISEIRLTPEYFIPSYQLLVQFMTTILMTELHRKPQKMLDAVLAVQKLAAYDLQLIEQAYLENTNKSFLFRISDMLNHITKLDTTEQLVTGMEAQNEETHNVSAAAEEMGASVEEVTSNAIMVAENAEEAVQSAEKSQATIESTLESIQEVGGVYDGVVKNVNQLEKEIDQTIEVVMIIKEIADQTNLLALNASIEAARAGEHGKGFAVVASEVRKLSEHTNEQIQQIEANIGTLRKVSGQVTSEINRTGELVEGSVSESEFAREALEEILKTMQSITQSTSQIAAMTEEQTSAVEEIAERTNVIHNHSQETAETAIETGRLVLELSEQMEVYRNLFLDLNMHMEYGDLVTVAITDHFMLRWKAYNTLLGLTDYSEDSFPTHEECTLGRWYYGDLPDHVRELEAFQALEEPHRNVHKYTKEAVRLYNEGRIEEAREALDNLTRVSNTVIGLLKSME